MGNSFDKRTDAQISSALALVNEKGDEAPYSLSQSLAQAVSAAQTGIDAAIAQTTDAAAALKASYRNKEAQKAAGVAALNAVATALYGKDLTPAQLSAIGITPKKTVRPRPAAATAVTGLIVKVLAESRLQLSFSRGSNPKSAMFVIEGSSDGLAWEYLRTTPRVTFTMDAAPGVPLWLRVTATTATTTAPPSAPVSVYAPGAPAKVALKLAA